MKYSENTITPPTLPNYTAKRSGLLATSMAHAVWMIYWVIYLKQIQLTLPILEKSHVLKIITFISVQCRNTRADSSFFIVCEFKMRMRKIPFIRSGYHRSLLTWLYGSWFLNYVFLVHIFFFPPVTSNLWASAYYIYLTADFCRNAWESIVFKINVMDCMMLFLIDSLAMLPTIILKPEDAR